MYEPANKVAKEKVEELKKGNKKRTLVHMKQADGQVALGDNVTSSSVI